MAGSQLSKYDKILGELLKRTIHLTRNNGNTEKNIPINIMNISKQKYAYLKNQNIKTETDNIASVAVKFPIIGYSSVGINYAPENRREPKNLYLKNGENKQYNKVPIDITYEIYVGTTYRDDVNMFIEEFLKTFDPSISVDVIIDNDINEKVTIPFVLSNLDQEEIINSDDVTEGKVYTINFGLLCKGFIYKDTSINTVINMVDIDFYANKNLDEQGELDRTIHVEGE